MLKLKTGGISGADLRNWSLIPLSEMDPAELSGYFVDLTEYMTVADMNALAFTLCLHLQYMTTTTARTLSMELRLFHGDTLLPIDDALEASTLIYPTNNYAITPSSIPAGSMSLSIPFVVSVDPISTGKTWLFLIAKSTGADEMRVDIRTSLQAGLMDSNGDVSIPISEADIIECVMTALVGDGPIAKTLTLRTTDGVTVVPGCKVWLSTTGDAAQAITAPVLTNDAGQVTYNISAGITYYVHCEKAGYSFTAWSFTSTTTPLTMDIATAVVTSDDVPLEQGFIVRTLATTRRTVDEPTAEAKYTDAILTGMLNEAYVHVYGEVTRNSSRKVVTTHQITLEADKYSYTLPYHAQTIEAIYQASDTGYKVFYTSRSRMNPIGRIVWIEGQALKIQPNIFPVGTVLTVEYVAGGGAQFCAGAVSSYSNEGGTLVLGSTPLYGSLDTHEKAYVGSSIRIWNGSGGESGTYERIVTDYDMATRTVTLDEDLGLSAGATLYYEIMPQIYKTMDHVVGLYMAMWISSIEGHPVRAKRIEDMYAKALRTVRLQEFYSKLDQSSDARTDNHDASRYRVLRNG